MRKTFFIFLVFLFSVTYNIYGQNDTIWTLEKCIEYAHENNLTIKQQLLSADMNHNNLRQSKAAVLPSLNASASQNLNYGRTIDPYTNEFSSTNVSSNSFSISAGFDLFKGLQNYNTIKQTELDLKSSLEQLNEIKNNISINIGLAYLQILYSKELVKVNKNQLDVTQQQVEQTQKLVDAGSLPQGSLLEIQAQEALEEVQLINAQNQLRTNYLQLTQLLDKKNTDNFKIAVPEFSDLKEIQTLPTVEEVYNAALNLPQIKKVEYQLQSAEYGLNIAKGNRSPQLSFSASYGTGYSDARQLYDMELTDQTQVIGYLQNDPTQLVETAVMETVAKNYPFTDQLADNASTMLSFRLTIPVFNKLQIQTAIDNSQIQIESTKLTLKLEKQNLYKEIQQAHNDALAALANYEGNQKAVESMKESFKYTEQKFKVGLVTSIEYNTAKNQLMKAESDFLQAKYEFIFNKSILNFYMGNPLKLE